MVRYLIVFELGFIVIVLYSVFVGYIDLEFANYSLLSFIFFLFIFQAEFLFHVGFREVRRKIRAFKELSLILSKLLDQKWNITSINRNQITVSRGF